MSFWDLLPGGLVEPKGSDGEMVYDPPEPVIGDLLVYAVYNRTNNKGELWTFDLTMRDNKFLQDRDSRINALVVTPAGKIIDAGNYKKIYITDPVSKSIRLLQTRNRNILTLALYDEHSILDGGEYGSIFLTNIRTKESKRVARSRGRIRALGALDDAIVFEQEFYGIQVRNIRTGKTICSGSREKSITCIATTPDGRILDGGQYSGVFLTNPKRGEYEVLHSTSYQVNSIITVGDTVFDAGMDKTIYSTDLANNMAWSITQRHMAQQIAQRPGAITSLAWGAGQLIDGGAYGYIGITNPQTGRSSKLLDLPKNYYITAMAVIPLASRSKP